MSRNALGWSWLVLTSNVIVLFATSVLVASVRGDAPPDLPPRMLGMALLLLVATTLKLAEGVAPRSETSGARVPPPLAATALAATVVTCLVALAARLANGLWVLPTNAAASASLWTHVTVRQVSSFTALASLLIAVAIALNCLRFKTAWRVSQLLVVASLCTPWAALMSIAISPGDSAIFQQARWAAVAALTSMSVVALAIGAFSLRPATGIAGLFAGSTAGSRLARRLLLTVLALPLLSAWIIVIGTRLGLFESAAGYVAVLMLSSAALVVIIFRVSMAAHRRDLEWSRQAAALRDAEARYRNLVEMAPDAAVILDQRGTITLVNRQTEALFGYSRSELVGQRVEVLLPEHPGATSVTPVMDLVDASCTEPMGQELDLRARRKDGTEFPVEISLAPLPADGELLVAASIRDSSERHRVESMIREANGVLERRAEELDRRNLDLEMFAQTASHDLQAPLRHVRQSLRQLERRHSAELPPGARDYLRFALDGTERMQALVRDVLEYSGIDRKERREDPVDLAALFERVCAMFEGQLHELGGTLTSDELPTVHGDHVQFLQLLQNLVGNAIKYHGERPVRVHVTAQLEGETWALSVADNGIGIDPKFHEVVFELFQRLHDGDAYPGTGVGLAICRRIVERQGGRLWLESQPGVGTTFHFTVPPRAGELRPAG